MVPLPPFDPYKVPSAGASASFSAEFPSPAARRLIGEALAERWEEMLETGQSFEVDGESQPGAYALLRISVVQAGQTHRYTVEVGTELKASSAADAELDVLMDAADALIGTHLEGGRPSVTGAEWSRARFRGRELAARAGFRDPALEQAANQMLGDSQPELLDPADALPNPSSKGPSE